MKWITYWWIFSIWGEDEYSGNFGIGTNLALNLMVAALTNLWYKPMSYCTTPIAVNVCEHTHAFKNLLKFALSIKMHDACQLCILYNI